MSNAIFKMNSKIMRSFLNTKALPCGNQFTRQYAVLKRFYKSTSILKSDGKYEVTLDQRKLKTPNGNQFLLDSEPLALAVAAEWDCQKANIVQSKMHITTLCNTVLDNPNNLTKYDMVNYITNYLETDTVLFQSSEGDQELYQFEADQWDPIIDWFNKRYDVSLQKSVQMDGPSVSESDKAKISKQLLSYNYAAVSGFVYGVDTLKSVILTLACIERFITPEKAVLLSRLEEEYQLGHWGRVEWAHDLSQQDLQARLSAVVLFVYFNSISSIVTLKQQKNVQ